MPDAPVALTDNVDQTSATQISFSWSDGESDGGAAVLDYRIYYDQTTDTWIELVPVLTDQTYTTVMQLSEGHTYSFKVQARNWVGYGDFSEPISILAAQIPD